eukprot:COSAG01_NODE_58323_length_306_cov_3.004831_1_plen_57_part_00
MISMNVPPIPVVQVVLVPTLRRASLLSLHAVLLVFSSVQVAHAYRQLRQMCTHALV